jgi:hypothetical protein
METTLDHLNSVSKEPSVYHTAKCWFSRIHLHGNMFITQRRFGFQESVSMETCFADSFPSNGSTCHNNLGFNMNLESTHSCISFEEPSICMVCTFGAILVLNAFLFIKFRYDEDGQSC